MAEELRQIPELDREAYEAADASLRLVSEHLPEDRVIGLAREVVKRLAFRIPADGAAARGARPTEEDIERFFMALMSPSEQAANRIILQAQRDGADLQTLYLGYIAGASRRLGEAWVSDEVSLVEVGLGTGRLYRIIRGLRHVIGPAMLEGRTHKPALFALVPGETHVLGIEMAADLFRRDGGEVDVCIGKTHDEILELAEDRHYGVVVLVANSDSVVSALLQLGVALRISQPLTPFGLAGNLVEDSPEIKTMLSAEMVITDIWAAIPELRKLTARKPV